MITLPQILEIVSSIEYKDWKLDLITPPSSNPYIQWKIPDNKAPMGYWNCRKWLLSPHMTKSEIIQTIFLAIQVAEEHESRESFKYKGESILSPHLDLEKLHKLISSGDLEEDIRAA